MPTIIEVFDKDYRDACFYSWYEGGRPSNIVSVIPEDKNGKKPSTDTLKRWFRDDGWREHADALDAQLSVAVENEIIERKRQDYIELAETGRGLIKGAVDYLEKEGYDTASSAVRAIGLGADMVAKYSRAAEMVDAVLGSTDKQIEKEIYRLLGKDGDADIVEVESETVEDSEEETDADSDSEEDNNS